VFCGSKKSMARGIPMADVLFAGQLCALLLPLMLFHQLQLMVRAVVARSYAALTVTPPTTEEPGVEAN
jgi:sodium/bile acid cotransporter 7